MYRHNGLLHSADGSANLLVDDPPQNAEKHQGWARDSFGYGYIKFAPQPVSYTHQGRTYTRDGALIVTGATPGAANDYKDGYGALCRADGALYIGSPSGGRRNQGWLVNSNGSAAVDGFGFFLGLGDKGSGEVNLVPGFANGSATPTFTRATTATTVNSAGLIVSVASGVPRSWYWPDTLAYGGYLAEGARTNLCLHSENLATAWVNVATTDSINVTTAPDGAATADRLIEDGTNTFHYIEQDLSFAVSTAYTFSVWAKQGVGTRNIQLLFATNTASDTASVAFNPSTGAVVVAAAATGAMTAVSATAQTYPNGWFRLTLSGTTGAIAGAGLVRFALYNGTAGSYLGDSTSGIDVWGAQLEAASFASTYIPTTTAAVTRNADVLTYQFSGNADATKGTAYAELGTEWTTTPEIATAIGFSDTALATGLINNMAAATTITINDSAVNTTKSGLTSMFTATRKRAASWGASLVVTGDGAAVTTSAFDGDIGSTAIGIGCSSSGARSWFGPIKNVVILRKQLANAQIQDMT